MAKKKMEKMEKLKGKLDFLMGHLKEIGGTSGEYAGTVLFLNEDSIKVEAALLAEILEIKKNADMEKEDIELEVWLVEQHQTLLRLVRKFNRCRDTWGRYGKHYALELDIEEMHLLKRILDDSGVIYWSC